MVQNSKRKSCAETKAEIEPALLESLTNICSLWNNNNLGNTDYNSSYREKTMG
jgi:hypothetical protein